MKKYFIFLLLSLTFSSIAAPIPLDKAFQLQPSIAKKTLNLHWQIAPGYRLYKDKISVKVLPPSQIRLAPLNLPAGIDRYDKVLGHYQVYRDQLQLFVPIWNYQPGEFQVKVHYQGCSDAGFCYPPQAKILTIQLSRFGAQISDIANAKIATLPAPKPTQAKHGLLLTLLTFFGLGILLAFTPCVLPMIPILSGIILGERRTMRQAFLLSLSYVSAMAITYAALGLLAGLAGSHLQAAMQKSWVIIVFSTLFVGLALSLFGVYELRLPHAWQQKLTSLSNQQRSGHYLGVAIMGALSVLIVSPCVSAPLVGALAYITETGSLAHGALILLAMGFGMGLPLLIIGTLGGRFIPRAGLWMNQIKRLLGILMLITAVWLLYRIIPGQMALILWGIIGITGSIWLGAFSLAHKSITQRVWQLLLLLVMVISLVLLIGGLRGNQDPFHPLSSTKSQQTLNFHIVTTTPELQQALAKAHGKPILLDFYASWCVSCRLMEQNIFHQADIVNALQHYTLIRVDVTDNTPVQQIIEKQWHVFAPPTLIFLDTNGKETKRLVGEISKHDFLRR